MKLAPRQIIDAALVLLNEVGIDELTTRKLADRLGVQQPALYWHFKNKRALLDAMNAEILGRGHTRRSPLPGEAWDTFLLENARSFRRALLSFRDGARVHAGNEPSDTDLPGLESQLRCLFDAGFGRALALRALVAIGNYVVGSVLEEQADAERAVPDATIKQRIDAFPLLRDAVLAEMNEGSFDEAFETGLGLIVEGLRMRLYQASMASRNLSQI